MKLKKRPVKGRCSVARCTNKAVGKMCSTHRAQKSRAADAVRYSFNNLRNRAKQRNIIFTITLDQFRDWCHKVTYIGFKGRKAESFTIDRIHNNLGYHIDNIQVMTKHENVKKYFSYDFREKTGRVVEFKEPEHIGDLPF